MFSYLLNIFFTVYIFMLLVRVLGSWIPPLAESSIMRFVAFYTDPYLNIFKRIIPPLGMIDLSPMVAFIALQLLQHFLLSMFK